RTQVTANEFHGRHALDLLVIGLPERTEESSAAFVVFGQNRLGQLDFLEVRASNLVISDDDRTSSIRIGDIALTWATLGRREGGHIARAVKLRPRACVNTEPRLTKVLPVPHSATAAAARAPSQRLTMPRIARVWAGNGLRFNCFNAGQIGSQGEWSGGNWVN